MRSRHTNKLAALAIFFAAIFWTASAQAAIVISEVMANASIPEDDYVELYNNGSSAVDVGSYQITDGDALDGLQAWNASGDISCANCVTNTTSIPAGGYALILHADYDANSKPYAFADNTIILRPNGGSSTIGNNIATVDPVTLYDNGGNSIATFGTPVASTSATWDDADDDGLDSLPFDGGTGYSWLKISTANANDGDSRWDHSRDCVGGGISPGAANTICDDKIIITEVLSNPNSAAEGQREYVELYNNGNVEIRITKYTFSDGAGRDDITGWNAATHGTLSDNDVVYDATTLLPGQYGVILDPDYDAAADQDAVDFPLGSKIFTVGDGTTIGAGDLSEWEPITLYNGAGLAVSTYGGPLASNRATYTAADTSEINVPDGRELMDNRGMERIATVTNGVPTYNTTDVWANDWQMSTDIGDWSPGWHSTTQRETTTLTATDIAAQTPAVDADNLPALAFRYANSRGNDLSFLKVVNLGNMTASDIQSLKLYNDTGTTIGTYNGSEPLLGTFNNIATQEWTLYGLSVDNNTDLLVVVSLSSTVASGETFRASIPFYWARAWSFIGNVFPIYNTKKITVQ